MRYIVLVAISLLSVLLTGGVFAQLPIIGANLDIVLAAMIAMEAAEGGITPVIYFSVASISLDVLIGSTIGMYSFPCAVAGIAAYFVFTKFKGMKFTTILAVGGGAWVIKEILMSIMTLFMGYSFDFTSILVRSILPGIPLQAAITFGIYCLMALLYRRPFMHPLPPPRSSDTVL